MKLRCAKIIANCYDYLLDIKYCGQDLQRKDKIKTHSDQYTSSQSCRYFILDSIFKGFISDNSDSFVDVGCGQGRVLAYLLNNNFRGKITGIESNPYALTICLNWAKKYDLPIIGLDVFNYNLNQFNIFFLGHPFNKNDYYDFFNKLEQEVKHKATIIIVLDLELKDSLLSRKGWSLLKRESIFKYYGMPILGKPNRFSIYSYTPYQ